MIPKSSTGSGNLALVGSLLHSSLYPCTFSYSLLETTTAPPEEKDAFKRVAVCNNERKELAFHCLTTAIDYGRACEHVGFLVLYMNVSLIIPESGFRHAFPLKSNVVALTARLGL
jgi:hypothetical protein